MLKPAFIDISHYQTIPESLDEAAEAGILGVIHKMTEGSSYVDDKADNRRYLAQEAGLLWGLYHFVRAGDMAQQVDHFLSAAGPYSDEDTLFVLDWEVADVSLDDAIEFLDLLEQRTGRLPVLYSGHIVKDALAGGPDPRINKYPLWLCHYTTGTPVLPPGWDAYWAWQYTDQGSCPGVNSPVDLNAFDGTADQLRASWSGSDAEPIPPEPEPEPDDDVVVTVVVPAGVTIKVIDETGQPVGASTSISKRFALVREHARRAE